MIDTRDLKENLKDKVREVLDVLQVVLPKRGIVGAEHLYIRFRKLVPLELDVGEFQGADAVCDLGESVLPGGRHPVQDGFL